MMILDDLKLHWLRSFRSCRGERLRHKVQGGPVPPELDRVEKTAARNFNRASQGVSFADFESACDSAAEISAENGGRKVSVCHLIEYSGTGSRNEYAVFPSDDLPATPGNFALNPLVSYETPLTA